jgi:type IV pilus assembly protein PilO
VSKQRKKGAAKKGFGKNGKLVLVVLGLVLVAAGGYFALVRPKEAEAKELEAKLVDLQTQIVMRTSAAQQKPVDIEAADLFRLAKAMPDRADMSGVILELNEVASDTGIVFESIVPGPSAPNEGYQVMPITLVFDGDFYSLSDFLFRLRNLVRLDEGRLAATGRLFAVESIAFAESETKFPNLKATLTVNAFVYGTGAPASTPPPATTGTTATTTDTTATTTTPAPTTPPPATPTATPQPAPTS